MRAPGGAAAGEGAAAAGGSSARAGVSAAAGSGTSSSKSERLSSSGCALCGHVLVLVIFRRIDFAMRIRDRLDHANYDTARTSLRMSSRDGKGWSARSKSSSSPVSSMAEMHFRKRLHRHAHQAAAWTLRLIVHEARGNGVIALQRSLHVKTNQPTTTDDITAAVTRHMHACIAHPRTGLAARLHGGAGGHTAALAPAAR